MIITHTEMDVRKVCNMQPSEALHASCSLDVLHSIKSICGFEPMIYQPSINGPNDLTMQDQQQKLAYKALTSPGIYWLVNVLAPDLKYT